MAYNWYDALEDRFNALAIERARSGDWTVSDLIIAYGSRRDLAEAYAEESGSTLNSAYKAISRLARYEAGERGGDVRSAAGSVRDTLNTLGENIEAPDLPTGGATVSIQGTIGVQGYGSEYESDRDIEWHLDEDELQELMEAAASGDELAASNVFGDSYHFQGMYIVDAEINIIDD